MIKLLAIIFLLIPESGITLLYKPDTKVANLINFSNNAINNPACTQDEPWEIRPFQVEIVAPSSGVQFYRNGIIFLSYSKNEDKVPEKHLSFGSLKTFMALVADTLPEQIMLLKTSTSALFPSEATTFSNDYNTMFISLIPERDDKEKIFKASFDQNEWKFEKTPVSFCRDNFIYTHPALSADGSFLIFSSDRSGSYGGLDLFISAKENGGWSNPKNLGSHINTTGNELFASLDAENNLYFSSDQLPGQGGYDIFVCRYNGKGWDKPHNLSKSVNTKDDEVAFTINKADGTSAFFTTRTKEGKRKIQLYIMSLNSQLLSYKKTNLSEQLFALAGIEELPPSLKPVKADGRPAKTADKDTIEDQSNYKDSTIQTDENKGKAITVTHQKVAEKEAIRISSPEEDKNKLIYRVQILANTKPVGSQDITIAGKSYDTYEYLHMGGYRTAVGEFSSLSDATKFQFLCRQNGYNQAFIAAFVNDRRISDSEAKAIEAGIARPILSNKKGSVVYRIQILSNPNPSGNYNLTVGGQTYQTFEYLYLGAYRIAIGEFETLKEAVVFQNLCRSAGYSNAFVVAFKNNVRSNDPELFK